MSNPYQLPESAKNYLDFLNSADGKTQQDVLFEAIFRRLPKDPQTCVLDAACGPGWLTSRLSEALPGQIEGFDGSDPLVAHARQQYPKLTFSVADAQSPLPYPAEAFDAVVLNMAALDMDKLPGAFKNISTVLKRGGTFCMTVPNPPFTYPAAEWKRSILDVALGRKPRLRLKKPYAQVRNIAREFAGGKTIASNFYTVSDYLQAAIAAGFWLSHFEELKSETDSPRFDLRYRLYRYPLFLVLEFTKN